MGDRKIETICVQNGWEPSNGEARVLPIYQSTTFKYSSSEEMAALFDLQASGFFYTRLANPTCDAVEKKIAALEGGVAAVLTASGQSASMFSILNICSAGDHVVCSSELYGGTFNLFNKTMRGMGIEFDFINPDAPIEEINSLFKDNTKCVFTETISNPSLTVLDIEKWANAAHSHNVPMIIDNTFATPVNCRPIEWGADIVVHSTSKYMDGHACSLGGCIVDSGKFDWRTEKFPQFNVPDETYHGVVYTEQFGSAAYAVKCRVHLMRDIGAMMSPQNAFLLNLGLETLHLRMARHCENALAVAEYLSSDDRIAWINCPSQKGSKYYDIAGKYMPNGTCGVISFGIKGTRETATKFMDSLELAAIVTHVADARTCVLHPASTTHRQLNDAELEACGVSPDLLRFSVGIENAGDIIEDIAQALDKACE
ncbi:MAG: aminotransferase class I/II-fold pyridoxal phosphate-dependent enzyme [Oscillospiraceae bacterium]|jgi:O-acetylhomoserine (thiol)-lyase|nr:aminotransferase class I/II-fold pyridoxal phosphate-dependent enzyme [Oscillospiraceae bacterium]